MIQLNYLEHSNIVRDSLRLSSGSWSNARLVSPAVTF
uniref:Uncharacterized protein n=1 Tax=Arundo donax TaxID=35708 RepID=A0A0A9BL07_ARUDO